MKTRKVSSFLNKKGLKMEKTKKVSMMRGILELDMVGFYETKIPTKVLSPQICRFLLMRSLDPSIKCFPDPVEGVRTRLGR